MNQSIRTLWLLALALIAGQALLALHRYEHDLKQSTPERGICAIGVSLDSAAPGFTGAEIATVGESTNQHLKLAASIQSRFPRISKGRDPPACKRR